MDRQRIQAHVTPTNTRHPPRHERKLAVYMGNVVLDSSHTQLARAVHRLLDCKRAVVPVHAHAHAHMCMCARMLVYISSASRKRACFSYTAPMLFCVLHAHVHMCVHKALAIKTQARKHVAVTVATDMCIDMCTDMCTDMCADMCADMCVDMCADMCADMCIDMCIDIERRDDSYYSGLDQTRAVVKSQVKRSGQHSVPTMDDRASASRC